MKKMQFLGLVLFCGFILGGCAGEDKESSDTNTTTNNVQSSNVTSTTKDTQVTETSGDFVETAADAYFDGTTLKGNTYTIKITDYKVILAGEQGNEYGDTPIIAFWYDTLVNPDYDNEKSINPTMAWISNFNAVQDNDPNIINKLDVAPLPDPQYRDTQTSDIKPGGTVSNAVGYVLTDTETPVTLNAESMLGDNFGTAEFTVK